MNRVLLVASIMLAALLSHLGAIAADTAAVAESAKSWQAKTGDAEKTVGRYTAVFPHQPLRTPSDQMVDGPLLGNGDVGVVLAGPPEELRLLVSKADFWKNTPRPLGQIVVATPAMKGARYHVEQVLYSAEAVCSFKTANAALEARTWVAAGQNTIVVELTARGTPLPVKAQFATHRSDGATGENTIEGGCFVSTAKYNSKDVFSPCEAAMACAAIGSPVTINKDGLAEFTLEPGRTVRLVASLATSHERPDYVKGATALATTVDEKAVETLRTAHRKWWSDFWSESFVQIGDELIEKYYYGAQYIMACCSRNPNFPPGLYGIWTTTDRPAWNGDYHLNYNQEGAYWGLYSSNHIAVSEPYDAPILAFMEKGKKNAKELLSCRGVYYPVGLGPKGLCTDGNFWGQKSNAAFAAAPMFMRYFHTCDLAYARRVYPYLLAVGDFWEDYLKLENGRYVINKDAFHEAGPWEGSNWADWLEDKNNNLSLGLVRMLFGGLIKISEDLNVDANRRDKWRDILAKISDWPTKEVGGKKTFMKAESGRGSTHVGAASWLMWGTVFPTGVVGRDTRDDLCEIFRREADRLDWDGGNAFCHIMPGAARAGVKPDLILQKIRARITGSGFPNLLVFQGGGGVETCGGITAGINEMLLQSYEGVIRVFPNWPKTRPARFGSLRAVGAFLVSSEYRDGQVQNVDILSEKGRTCAVQNPWPGGTVIVAQEFQGKSGPVATTVAGDKIAFATLPGGIYRLNCPNPPPTPPPAAAGEPQSDVIITGPPECLLVSGEPIKTDGRFIQATRFGSNTEDISAFGIKWSKWPGKPACKYGPAWAREETTNIDANGNTFTGDAGELMKWTLDTLWDEISGTFSDLTPGKRYRVQFLVNNNPDNQPRGLRISVAGASTGDFDRRKPLVVTFEFTASKPSEPWRINGAYGKPVGFALFEIDEKASGPTAPGPKKK